MQNYKMDSLEGKKDLPLVSVIIPYHDDFEYINVALRSCINNTYSNFEIIIIDDCSDQPLRMDNLNIDLNRHPITIIRNETNRGPGYSRNVGIKKAKGELIAFLDADDIWMPEIVEKQVEIFLSDEKAVWVYTDGYYLIENKRMHKPNSFYHGFDKQGFPTGKEVNEYHLRGYNYMTFSSNMFKKSAFWEAGFFDESLRVSEDWDLFVRMAEKYSVHAINEPLMLYRVNNAGRHFVNREDYVAVNVKILEDLYKRQGLLPSCVKDFNLAAAMIYQRAGIQRMNAGLNPEARHFLFHPQSGPLRFQFRMICLRVFSFMPDWFYRMALWLYDFFGSLKRLQYKKGEDPQNTDYFYREYAGLCEREL